jgi:hypothetical protein
VGGMHACHMQLPAEARLRLGAQQRYKARQKRSAAGRTPGHAPPWAPRATAGALAAGLVAAWLYKLLVMSCRTQTCRFSGLRIYPGKGVLFIRVDGQVRRGQVYAHVRHWSTHSLKAYAAAVF